jgi:CubicO group peptidase (beta-lactamase class C family)
MRDHLVTFATFSIALAACGGGTTSPEVDASSRSTAAIRAVLQQALPNAPAGVGGITLIVNDAADHRVIQETVGSMATDRRLAIASASKLVTGLVLLRLVDDGVLSMSDTPGSVLGWSATAAAGATLDQLGAFVSGMKPEAGCLLDPNSTLQACVSTLETVASQTLPGAAFQYGSTHQALAAAMAEVASGESWASSFERLVKAPLGLTDPGLRYYTLPKDLLGNANPLVAGGMRATADEYMTILAVLFHRGHGGGQQLISEASIARMGLNGYPAATVDPALAATNLRYSWSSWINCPGAASPCENVTSPGAFGFTPWVDRQAGYYALLVMESNSFDGAGFAVPVMEQLRPAIEAFLAP